MHAADTVANRHDDLLAALEGPAFLNRRKRTLAPAFAVQSLGKTIEQRHPVVDIHMAQQVRLGQGLAQIAAFGVVDLTARRADHRRPRHHRREQVLVPGPRDQMIEQVVEDRLGRTGSGHGLVDRKVGDRYAGS